MFWVGLQSRDVLDTVCAGLLPADVITDHPSGWRFKALKCFVFMMKDILAAPFLLFSVVIAGETDDGNYLQYWLKRFFLEISIILLCSMWCPIFLSWR